MVDPDVITAQIATSTTASYLFARAAHPHLVANRGTLILLTSPAGMEGSGNLPVYATVKGAQRGLLKSLAREWGPDGIRVNAIAPGPTDTPAMQKQVPAEFHDMLVQSLALKRMGTPGDHVGPVLFLLSDEAAWMTGHVLAVDGGQIPRI